jgi:hypothetical protein
MNRFQNLRPFPYAVWCAVPVMALAICFSSSATVYLVTDTVSVGGKSSIVRASSELVGPKTDLKANILQNFFDNDSTTRWMDGSQVTGVGEWIDIKFPEKRKLKGMIFGAGCRKDLICLEDNSVPTKIRIKLDEKPSYEYTIDWDVKADPPSTLTREEVNMRKCLLWFNTDTAFTTAVVQIKFEEVRKGARYEKLAMSDFELVEPNDKRFEIYDILSPLTFNPNDAGVINSPVLLVGDDEPRRIKVFLDSLYSGDSSDVWKQDSAKIEKGLNAGMHAITDGAEVTRLVGVLKKILIQDNRLVRFRKEGRTTTYMLQAGAIFLGGKQWGIWRYISTIKTSKGIELTIRYVPFPN